MHFFQTKNKFTSKRFRAATTHRVALCLISAIFLSLLPVRRVALFRLSEQLDGSSGNPANFVVSLLSAAIDFHFALLPDVEQEILLSEFKRHASETISSSFHLEIILPNEPLVASQHYAEDNELQYNLPAIVYRQPSSNHATEG